MTPKRKSNITTLGNTPGGNDSNGEIPILNEGKYQRLFNAIYENNKRAMKEELLEKKEQQRKTIHHGITTFLDRQELKDEFSSKFNIKKQKKMMNMPVNRTNIGEIKIKIEENERNSYLAEPKELFSLFQECKLQEDFLKDQ